VNTRLTPRQLAVATMTVLLNMLAVLNFRSLGAAMAEIAQDVGAGPEHELWFPDAFLTALIVATPISAHLVRRWGPHRVLVGCILGSVVASVLTSAANGTYTLAGLLFLQGLFAGPIAPTTQTVIVNHFPAKRRGTGMAIWNAGATIGVLTGSLAGGYLTELYNWRVLFLLAVPLGALSYAFVVKVLPHQGGSADVETDWRSILLLAGGLTALGGAVNLADDIATIGASTIAGFAATAIIALGLFHLFNGRSTVPILNLRVLSDHQLAATVAIILGASALNFGLLETEALTEIMGFDAETVGLTNAIRALAFLGGVAAGARLVDVGFRRGLALLALALIAIGKLGTTLYGADTGFFGATWPPVLSQAGLGMLGTGLAVLAFETVAPALIAAAASLFVFSRVFGNAIGLAAANTARSLREDQLVAAGDAHAVAAQASFFEVFWVGIVLTLLLMPLAWRLRASPQST
jgi:DHA2 family multidrug resistance protein